MTKPTKRRVKSRGPKHHAYPRGTLMKVVLRNGNTLYGRLKEKNRRYCLLEEGARIPWKKVLRFVPAPKVTIHSAPKPGHTDGST